MKVYEIINEEWYNPLSWFPSHSNATANVAKTQISAAMSNDDLKRAMSGEIKVPGMSQKEVEALYKSIAYDGNKAARAAAWEKRAVNLGNIAWVLKLLGVVTVCAELCYNLDQAEEAYIKGQLKTKEQFQTARQAFIGQWMIRFFTPWLSSMLLRSKWVLGISRFILGLLTLGTGVLDGPAALVGIVAEQAVFIAISEFLQSKMFEQWCGENVALLAVMGYWPDTAWDNLRKYLSEIPVLNTFMKNKGQGYYDSEKENRKKVNPEADAEEASIKAANAKSAKNAVVIAGIRITDADGYIDDEAYLNPNVQYAIKNNPTDPNVQKAATLPRRPGSIADKPLAHLV